MNDVLGKKLEAVRIRTVLPFIKGRLLDIGCGMNNLVRAYGRNGLGADVHDWGDIDVLVKDSSHLPFADAEFDTITIIAALNHIPNRESVLRECARLLSEKGFLIITMIPPRISAIWHFLRSPWDVDQHERGMSQGEVYGLTVREVVNLVEPRGFRLIIHKRFMFAMNSLFIFEKQ